MQLKYKMTDEEFAFQLLKGFTVGDNFELTVLEDRNYIVRTAPYTYTVLKPFNLANGSFAAGDGFTYGERR